MADVLVMARAKYSESAVKLARQDLDARRCYQKRQDDADLLMDEAVDLLASRPVTEVRRKSEVSEKFLLSNTICTWSAWDSDKVRYVSVRDRRARDEIGVHMRHVLNAPVSRTRAEKGLDTAFKTRGTTR